MGLVIGGVLALLCLVGCSEAESFERAAVDGTVTWNDAPLESGTIRFVPRRQTRGPVVFAPIIDGAFQLPVEAGPVPGRHTVEVTAMRRQPRESPHAQPMETAEQFIPARYNVDTVLEADIEAGTNTLKFELQSRAEK